MLSLQACLRYPDSRDEGDPVGDPLVELARVDIDVTGMHVCLSTAPTRSPGTPRRELFGILTNPLVWDMDGDGLGDGETVVVQRGTGGSGGQPQRGWLSPGHPGESETAGIAGPHSSAMPPAADPHTGYGGEGG